MYKPHLVMSLSKLSAKTHRRVSKCTGVTVHGCKCSYQKISDSYLNTWLACCDSWFQWPVVGSGDAAARLAFDKIIQPAAIRFQPNIILISAGYDAHWRDPLEKLNFYSSTYHFLTRRVKQLSNKLCGEYALHEGTACGLPGSIDSSVQ